MTGLRAGEKMLETLINETQSGRIEVRNEYIHIRSIFEFKKTIDVSKLKDYNSMINPLSKNELNEYLLDHQLL